MADASQQNTQNLPASFPWLEKLVSFPTVSFTSNLELVALIEQEFARHGIETHRTYSDDGERADLFATVPAADGTTTGGTVLSGHLDVVPVEGQPWNTDPFEAVVRDGRVYGRGTADMKSFSAAALEILPRVVEAELAEPIHFAFTYDEEPGCLGAPRMIEAFRARGVEPARAVVGEPTLMNVVVAHKSPLIGQVSFRGVPKHSSLAPQGVNAIAAAGEFVHFFTGLARELEESGPRAEGFNIEYTTGGVNTISGGTAQNIVPDRCELRYDFRLVPGQDGHELVRRIDAFLDEEIRPRLAEQAERVRGFGGADEKALAQVGADHEVLALVPPLETAREADVVAFAESLGAEYDGGGESPYVSYGTEAGQYAEAGIPAIVCGPASIAQAHTENEWVALEQLEACEAFMAALLERSRK